jgi:hypothetical protein
MLKTGRLWLWIIVGVAVVARLGTALYAGDRVEALPGAYDQITYDALARSLLAGQGYSFESDWYPFTPANTPTAHWSFLYPLYLTGVYAVFGPHALIARLIQAALSGMLAVWLQYRLGHRLFDRRVGLLTAALSAGYIYFIFFDAMLTTESFYMLGVLGLLNLALAVTGSNGRTQFRATGEDSECPSPRHRFPTRWVLLGVVVGVTALLRQSILPWVPVLLAWTLWMGRGQVRWRHLLIPVLILALFIAPWSARNLAAYGAFLPLNSNAGWALYAANHPALGTRWIDAYVPAQPPEIAGLNEAEMNGVLMRLGIQFILKDPGRVLLLSLNRLPGFFKFWPSPNSHILSNISRVFSYGVYLPFFLYGLFLSRKRWRRCSLIYSFAVVYCLMHILTYTMIRYRLPVDAALMPFAALAVVDLIQRARLRRRRTAIDLQPAD